MQFLVAYLSLKKQGVPVEDTVLMAGSLKRRINLSWSARRWKEAHDKFSRMVTLEKLAKSSVDYSLDDYRAVLPNHWPGYLIGSSVRLGMEGLRQRNCVASYDDGIQSGRNDLKAMSFSPS